MERKHRDRGHTDISAGIAYINKLNPEITRTWYARQVILGNVLRTILNEPDHRIDLIVEMIEDHGMLVINEARNYTGSNDDAWNFMTFVMGAKAAVIDQLKGRVSDSMILALAEIVPDGSRYGSFLERGRCDENVAELFMDMMVDGVVEERIGELISYDVELYGGHVDEPDEDEELDRLLEGIADMMEGHGIRGDVRAKAKEFLTAVAMDTLALVNEDE